MERPGKRRAPRGFLGSSRWKDDFVSWIASCRHHAASSRERTQVTHTHAIVWLVHARTQSKQPGNARIHLGTHVYKDTHIVRAPWLPSGWFVSRDPSYSAGLNKSHQVGSDSSYVDGMPNVIWRLGEHEIGPSSASSDTLSLCDVVLSCSVFSSSAFFFFYTLTHSHPHETIKKHTLTHSAGWNIILLCKNRGHQFTTPPPHPTYPLRLFVLFFMFHFPSTYAWSLLSL